MLCTLEYRVFQTLIKPQLIDESLTQSEKYRVFQTLIKPQHKKSMEIKF